MGTYTKTPSAVDAIGNSHSDWRTRENYKTLKDTLFDKVQKTVDEKLGDDKMNELFGTGTMSKEYESEMAILANANTMPILGVTAGINDLRFTSNQEGFPYQWTSTGYMLGAKWTNNWKNEEGKLGVRDVGRASKDLQNASIRTMTNIKADILNRGISASTCPFLCSDGEGLVADDRVNPDPRAPNWSNLIVQGAITEDYLFDAMLFAKRMISPNGDRLSNEILKIFIPEASELDAYHVSKTAKDVDTTNNTVNWAFSRFNFQTLKYLSTDRIFFKVGTDMDNGLKIKWYNTFNIQPLTFAMPHVDGVVAQMAFSIGCVDPRREILGGFLA